MVQKTILLITSVFILALFSIIPAQAKICKGHVSATGSKALTWSAATVKARARWRSKVRRRYGSAYATRTLARNRNIKCWRSGGITKRCRVSGHPCRL